MGKINKNCALLDKLVMLEAEEKCLIRNLNIYYRNTKLKEKLFIKLKKVRKEIEQVKFKLRVEREIRKNDKDNFTS